MPPPLSPDAAVALDAVRAQRAAAVRALHELDLYRQLEPKGECLTEWTGPSSRAYESDLAAVLSSLSGVRFDVAGAIDDLWRVVREHGDD